MSSSKVLVLSVRRRARRPAYPKDVASALNRYQGLPCPRAQLAVESPPV
jgi:hypothetical protein